MHPSKRKKELVMKKIFLLVFAAILAVAMCACSASKSVAEDAYDRAYDNGFKGEFAEEPEMQAMGTSASFSETKIAYSYRYTIQTKNFDEEYEKLNSLINSFNGTLVSMEGYNKKPESSTDRGRSITVQVKISADKADEFAQNIDSSLTVINSYKSGDDVTKEYNDTEIRINTLEARINRLNELFKEAKSVTEMTEIEKSLFDAIEELEVLKGTIKYYDSIVDYSSFSITISELNMLTNVEKETTFGERIGAAASGGFNSFVDFLEAIVIFLIAALPFIVFVAIVIVVIIVAVKRSKKKKIKNEN